MRVAIYCRVSTKEQDDQMQLDELQALCLRSGWTVAAIYRDKASGTADQRAALNDLLIGARHRQFEKVVVWSVDRLARSLRQLVNVLSELNDCGVQLSSYRQGIDTSSPMGAMLWQFLGIFAEFEHGIRKDRQAAGIARAKARGVRFGRPPISRAKQQEIVRLRAKGLGINRIAQTLRVGSGTVAKIAVGYRG
jgi:DNA invertase Pin-like site-specific DNA recombinase